MRNILKQLGLASRFGYFSRSNSDKERTKSERTSVQPDLETFCTLFRMF